MSDTPLFSIVIPTRNRAHLLPNSLQSALEQTHHDYEVIVSDNNCSPETEEVVRRLGNERVRHVRVDRTLAMPDSWEFALSHARGEYITILSDDDAVSPTLLERLNTLLDGGRVKLISWIRYLYVMNDWYVEAERNKLFLGPVSGQAEERSSESILRRWFDGCSYYSDAPMLFNACCHRSVIDAVKGKAGRLFLGSAPDIASSLALLSQIPSFAFVDDVLSLAGSGKQSIGANSMHGRSGPFQEFVTELDDADYPKGPFKAITLTTSVADTLLRVKEALSDVLADYDINWSNYFIGCYRDLVEYEKAGSVSLAEISREKDQLLELVGQQTPEVQLAFSQMKTLLGPGPSSTLSAAANPYMIAGKEAGFNNILECARLLDSIVATIKQGNSPLAVSNLPGS